MREEKTLGLTRVETKADGDGLITELTGYCAAFNNVDHGGDVILPGAFVRTIAERVAAGKVRLLADHIWDTEHVLGTWTRAEEDQHGLLFAADVDSDPMVQRIVGKVARKHVTGLSIGYEAMEATIPPGEPWAEQGAWRVLNEIKLFEGSVTPFPMNEEAFILGVKGSVPRGIAQAQTLLQSSLRQLKAGHGSGPDETRIVTALALLQELLDSVTDDATSGSPEPDGKAAAARLMIAQGMIAAHRAQTLNPHVTAAGE